MKLGRRLAFGGVAVSLASTAAAIALVRPASADTTTGPVGMFGATVTADAVTSSGTLDASGGLVLTDSGAATANGLLDNSPSSRTSAVAAEPGTTARTLSASEGGPLPPGAAAQYPGGPATSNDSTVGMTSAAADEMSGSASASSDPSGSNTAATATLAVKRDAGKQNISATGTANSGSVAVGPLTIGAVTGTATVSYDPTGHHASAGTVVTGASVAGMPVTIDDSGVHLSGAPPTGPLVPVATPVNTILAAAGVSATVVQPTMTTTARNGFADSGALVIHETTTDATSGTTTVSSATDITLYLGRATVTLADQLPNVIPMFVAPVVKPSAAGKASAATTATSAAPVAVVPAVPGKPAVPGRVVTTVIPGSAPVPVSVAAAAPPPAIAQATQSQVVQSAPAAFAVLHHRLGANSALAGFGAWQLLTLGIATTGAMIARRRTDPEEEHLCPCP